VSSSRSAAGLLAALAVLAGCGRGCGCSPTPPPAAAGPAPAASPAVPAVLAELPAGRDPGAAAGKLFIHKNTLFYRINKAKELFGLNLSDGYERLRIYLTMIFMEL
jgi:hypothetical protein